MYPSDDAVAKKTHPKVRSHEDSKTQSEQDFEEETLAATMQEALQRHWDGIAFRERSAGPAIDNHMTTPGFQVTAYVHPDSGLVFGGNSANCGTWMDKMGGSERAHNKGVPATPRDGAAVELQVNSTPNKRFCRHSLLQR